MRGFITRHYRKFLIGLAVILLVGGGYLLILLISPRQAVSPEKTQELHNTPIGSEKRLIIPKIGVNVIIRDGGMEVLREGAWHRFPERGNPVTGGNFIVTAHRFVMDYTPIRVQEKSYLYNINKLGVGDDIIIHWEGKRYDYKISETKQVKPTAIEIEAPSEEAILTMYACTLAGSADGRVVVLAKPVEITTD